MCRRSCVFCNAGRALDKMAVSRDRGAVGRSFERAYESLLSTLSRGTATAPPQSGKAQQARSWQKRGYSPLWLTVLSGSETPPVSILHVSLNLRSYLRRRRFADRRRGRGTARRLMVRLHALLLGSLLARVCSPSRWWRRRVIFRRRWWCGLRRRRERGSSWAAHWTAI